MENIGQNYDRNRHSIFCLKYHLVIVTKYRRKVINNDIKNRLFEISEKLFTAWESEIIEINTDLDHVHIFFSTKPQVQLSKLVNNYKTVTSRYIRSEFSDYLSRYYWKPYFWSKSYFISTVGDVSEDNIRRYILDQGSKNTNSS